MESLWSATNSSEFDSQSSHTMPRLQADHRVDIAIVGGGYTGLWTARYLALADPSLKIAIVDANVCGFGASSRNGGWCSALFPTGHDSLVNKFGAASADALRVAARTSVDEVGRAAAEDGIECDFAKGGTLVLATNPAHVERVANVEDGEEWLDATAARTRLAAAGTLGAAFTPHCAALHPARLASGLARTVRRLGVEIFEHSPVAAIDEGVVIGAGGERLRAPTIIRATEGFTPTLSGQRRAIVPIYSLMIATEPLSDELWASIGLHNRETFSDGRNMLIYGQRTADGRFAFGGRGAPYHFGSSIRPAYDLDPRVFAELEATLRRLFPQLSETRVTHRWGGPLGVPRDWMASVGFDRSTGIGWAGGYVGDGVAMTNLAGRTLRDLILGDDTKLTALPWVNHRSPKWEPEPLRWVGINLGRTVADVADRFEHRTERPATWATRLMSRFTGG